MQLESLSDASSDRRMVSNCDSFFLQHRTASTYRFEDFVNFSKKESLSFSKAVNLKECRGNMKSNATSGILMEGKSIDVNTCTLDHVNENSTEETDAVGYPQSEDAFPVQFEDFFVLSPGEIDTRPAYHSEDKIFPVGYKSCWHDKITGSLFLFYVLDGGVDGPIFKVERYPCSSHPFFVASTILSRAGSGAPRDEVLVFENTDSNDSVDIQMILTDIEVPCLEDVQDRLPCDNSARDGIGNFTVEGRSSSSVWFMVSQEVTRACRTMLKQKGQCNAKCSHISHDTQSLSLVPDEMTKFSSLLSMFYQFRSDDDLDSLCQTLETWLGQDRFGFDICFVQEITEQLAGAQSLSKYISITKRKKHPELQTVGNGYLVVQKREPLKRRKEISSKECKKSDELYFMRYTWPPGKPLSSQLPKHLIDDAVQFWELLWHFSDVVGLEEPVPSLVSFAEELIGSGSFLVPYLGSVTSQSKFSFASSGSGLSDVAWLPISDYLSKVFCLMLKLLFSELQGRVDISLEKGEWKLRKRTKMDGNKFCFFNHNLFGLLCINELTWPELARRYLLNMSFMENNADMLELLGPDTLAVLCCVQGHNGTTGSSVHNGVQSQADSQLLAEALKKIYGTLMDHNEDLKVDFSLLEKLESINETESLGWVEVLEPARKLPTNVGARIRNCVNEALSLNPPEWARKRLEYSISKEVYKGNASGPTKKIILSVLADVNGNNEQQKTNSKTKKEICGTLSDLIMKQCQKVLRMVVSSDAGKSFSCLRGRIRQTFLENDDDTEKNVGNMILCPFDLRVIDSRLEFGVYAGCHAAFAEDVREVLNKIRVSYTNQPDLLDVIEALSQCFELLYENEVLTFAHKLADIALNDSTTENAKELESILEVMGNIPIPSWDDGVCKVCGIDEDDDNVLLCDTCDSGYHTYCLKPPLEKIPVGNWYCPSCTGNLPVDEVGFHAPQKTYKSHKRKRQEDDMHKRCHAVSSMRSKMKVSDFWEFNVEEKVLLLKILSDQLIQSSSLQEYLKKWSPISEAFGTKSWALSSDWRTLSMKGVSILPSNDSLRLENGGISGMVPCITLQTKKFPIRKELIGCDSVGRNYWLFSRSELCSWVAVEAANSGGQEASVSDDLSTSSQLLFYKTDTDIQDLIKWLTNNCPSQRQLINKLEHVSSSHARCLEETGNVAEQSSSKSLMCCSNGSRSLMTNALATFEAEYGSLDLNQKKFRRCDCLELLWPSRFHCQNCHSSFSVISELSDHNRSKCGNAQNVNLDEKEKTTISMSLENSDPVSSGEFAGPFNIEEISSRFRTKSSNMELVKEIGLLGSDGIPLFLQSSDPNGSDPSLRLNSCGNRVDRATSSSNTIGGSPKAYNEEQNVPTSASKSTGSSMKVLVGKGRQILKRLQISLLDMDAALPEGSLKLSKSSSEKRNVWRAFVKSAKTVSEMVQATVVLEDSMKAEYLKMEWWYWSSLSPASIIATVSSLALRIYALDASILYTKSPSSSLTKPDSSMLRKPLIKYLKKR